MINDSLFFNHNFPSGQGAALIFYRGSSGTVTNSKFIGNNAYYASEIRSFATKLIVSGYSFINNTAGYNDVMYLQSSSNAARTDTLIRDSLFLNNITSQVAVLGVEYNAALTVDNCTFSSNIAATLAGVMNIRSQ